MFAISRTSMLYKRKAQAPAGPLAKGLGLSENVQKMYYRSAIEKMESRSWGGAELSGMG